MNEQVTVLVNSAPVRVERGACLSEVVMGEKPCGGHGKCGKCKVFATGELSPVTEEERRLLSRDEVEQGIRLACVTCVLGECTVKTLSVNDTTEILTVGTLSDFSFAPTFTRYGVAIDIGTTTVAARLYNADGRLLSDASALNPQQKWGADVVSRVEAALGGAADSLADAIRSVLDTLIEELSRSAGIDAKEIDGAVVTGNTVMLSLFVMEDVAPLSCAPFVARRLFGESLTAGELSLSTLSRETPIYLPPCISAFVGADMTSAILATGLCKGKTALLVDIGTNGEIALWRGERLIVCSTAAGPAFEGVGISMGMRSALGAIDKVTEYNGRLYAHVIGGEMPKGICGSGLVDAVAALLDLEILDESGLLENGSCTIEAPVMLTQGDIRMFQLAKGAITAGIETLLREERVSIEEITTLYIAGGFGAYLNMKNAVRVGLLHGSLARASRTVGNAALSGASMLLLSRDARKEAETLAKGAKTLVLSANPTFVDLYMRNMTFEAR